MSYRTMLTHRCDIYHLKQLEGDPSGRFGVPVEDFQPVFEYPDEPDHANVPCYFTERNQTVTQGEPNQTIVQSYLIHFLPSADIRINDKVVWDGVTLRLQKPRLIKNHHYEVTAVRSESL